MGPELIPNVIQICGVLYTIDYQEKLEDCEIFYSEDLGAAVNYDLRKIQILTAYKDGTPKTKQAILEYLTHECAHAFMYESGNQDLNEERQAELMGKFVTNLFSTQLIKLLDSLY